MAKVDFGAWKPSEQERAAIEEQAAKLPAGWKVSLGMNSDASRCISVVVEGDRADYMRTFEYGRFDLIAFFLESLAATPLPTVGLREQGPEMSSDSPNSVSVGLGQLLVEGKGPVGTVEYTLVERTTPSGLKSRDWTVTDILFSTDGPDSVRRVDYHDLQKQNAPLVLIHNGGSFSCMIAGVGHSKATLVPRSK